MMNRILRRSLPLRAWAAVFAISVLCLISALSSGLLAWVSQTDAQAINTAGSVRMATYRIKFQLATDFADSTPASLAFDASHDIPETDIDSHHPANSAENQPSQETVSLINDMESRLAVLHQYQLAYANRDLVINNQFEKIEAQWFNKLKPALVDQNKQDFYAFSSQYIEDVDRFVSKLQYRNEQRQIWQQSLQVASIILTIIIMLFGMHTLRRNVLTPVQQLIDANSRFEQGKHGTRVSISGYEEFNALGESFNDMASTIETYQHSLKKEVDIKTQHLVKANQVLSLFYDFSKHLTTSKISLLKLDNLITDFGEIFPHLDFTLCIQNDALQNKDSIALHDDKMKELCSRLNCDNCSIKEDVHIQTYPITHQNDEFGELKVRPKSVLLMNGNAASHNRSNSPLSNPLSNDKANILPSSRIKTIDVDNLYLNAENSELIIALTNLISTALSLRKQRQQEHQLILFEERSTIARELHDSLAQSLSYLKIQVSVLERHLANVSDKECATTIAQYIEQIKAGLSSAYQQLRDLLVTFRLTIDSDNFDDALHEAATEFSTKGGFDVAVNNKVMTLNLNANEQVNLIQIVREALSNISRHAQATNVTIDLGYNDTDEYIVMQIIDDGIGISGTVDQSQHHGLMIMEERARHLGGTVKLSDNQPTGTIVTTTFTPNFFYDYTAP